jgi:DNA polymerase III epsilon subunit-like protein
MYLFFDTETTGLPLNWKAPLDDLDNWPRMVQIAWLLYDYKGNLIKNNNYIIRPEGFTIPEEAAKVHGISTSKALKKGKDLRAVLQEFNELIAQADCLVAHNMSFDEKIVGAEFLRKEMDNIIDFKKKICTMQCSADICMINGPYGYKWPKLSELYYQLFGKDFKEAHNALNDINATAECFWEMKRLYLI